MRRGKLENPQEKTMNGWKIDDKKSAKNRKQKTTKAFYKISSF